MASITRDPTFTINDFGTAKFKSESQTLADSIVNLLFAKPGSFPSMPYLGMDIQSMIYKFEDEINTTHIKAKLMAQCEILSPYIASGELIVEKTQYRGQGMLLIVIPLEEDQKKEKLVIGITENKDGQTVYNYVFEE